MKKIMERFYKYITAPETIISFMVFIFSLGVVYTNITGKQNELEDRITKIEKLDLDSRLTRMQIDLDWIKKTLDELKEKK